jgi:hypothetical protein
MEILSFLFISGMIIAIIVIFVIIINYALKTTVDTDD